MTIDVRPKKPAKGLIDRYRIDRFTFSERIDPACPYTPFSPNIRWRSRSCTPILPSDTVSSLVARGAVVRHEPALQPEARFLLRGHFRLIPCSHLQSCSFGDMDRSPSATLNTALRLTRNLLALPLTGCLQFILHLSLSWWYGSIRYSIAPERQCQTSTLAVPEVDLCRPPVLQSFSTF